MVTRRPAAARKRATPLEGQPLPVHGNDVADQASREQGASAVGPDELARGLLNKLEDALREQHGVDEQEREEFLELFGNSLRDVVASEAYARPPSEAEWQATIEALKQQSAEAGGSDGALARQLAGAVATLEQRKTKVTLEFSRRMHADGQESALAWLKEQRDLPSEPQRDPVAGQPAHVALPEPGGDITKSRSRRLRGPPK